MARFEQCSFDGFEGMLARPDSPSASPAPGVLVMPDAFGIGEFSIEQAGRLADLGFVALAGDPWGGGFYAASEEEITPKFVALTSDDDGLRTNVRSNMDALAAIDGVDTDRLGAIGYCLGGTAVLELARSGYPCRGVVSFHGLLATAIPATLDALAASLLVCTGADDPYAPLTDVTAFQAEMTAADADCQVVVYTGAQHSWTNPDPSRARPGIAYHPQHAARSWDAMLAFLHERVGAPAPA
jgi:dienelactone hydrolase